MISGRSFVDLALSSLEDSTVLFHPGLFKRKKMIQQDDLGFVQEDEDEPPEEETAYTSKVIRLATVDSGDFVEWAKLGAMDGLSRFPLWDLEDIDSASTSSGGFSRIEEEDLDEYQDEERDDYRPSNSSYKGLKREKANRELLKQMATEPYTLMHFGRRGEAELIRLLFVMAGEKYVEKNVIEEELEKVLEQSTPYQTLPVVTKGSFSWGGSEAIARMLARKFYLMGETNHDHLIVEAMFERLCRCKRTHASVVSQLPLEIKKREKLDWIEHQLRYVILPPAMAEWEKLIMSSKGPYIVESGMTLADLAIVDFLDQCSGKINIKDLLMDFEILGDLMTLVKKHPRIEAYLDERDDKDKNRKVPTDTS